MVYETSYFNISNCNYFIELVERGDAKVSETRKNELIAEAKFFRGLTHFNLLKVFGQFYDLNSDLGVVVITEPIRGNIEFPRNTVKETYDAIISDLQFAADYGVGNREHYYVSATTARAQLAKVQLYMGDYTNSASNALDVINNTDNYILESDYKTVFADRWGPETLLAAFVDVTTEGGAQAERFRRDVVGPSTILANLADAQDGVVGNGSSDYETGYDPRLKVGFYQDPTAGTFYIGKYPIPSNFGNANEGNAIKVLRMSEMYLIYAEAEARRQGGDLTEALNKLNAIRNRVNITPKILSDKATLLEDIRLEKLLELYCETGESWFDLVRYDRLGDITASTIKATVSSVDKLIFPLPNNALLGNKLLVPNP